MLKFDTNTGPLQKNGPAVNDMKQILPKVEKPLTVLVTDDAPDIVLLVSNILEKDGYLLLKSYSGEECIALANANHPDIILLDVMMPDIDGFKVCERLKADSKTKDIPIVFITAKIDTKDKILGLSKGATDYITKPFNPEELKARVKSHLQTKIMQDKLRETNNILTEYLRTATLTNDFFENITKLVNLQEVMSITKKYFSEIFEDVERFSVWLYDSNSDKFVLEVAKPASLEKKAIAIKVDDSPIMKKALDRKEVVVENNFKNSDLYNAKTGKRYKDAKFMCLPLMVEGKVLAIVNLTSKKDGSDFSVYDQQKAISICQILANKIENCQLYKKIETLSVTDSLTNLYNRQFLDNRMGKDFARVVRSHEPFTIIMADIDHFKSINDTFGHQAGDVVLKQFSEVVVSSIREADFAARYGGEEFVITLPATDLLGGIKLAEKIRRKVEKTLKVTDGAKNRFVTVSLGVSSLQNQNYKHPDELLKAADDALYRAKEEGRNRVCYDKKFI